VRNSSLRARLLVAVGAVALLALLLADVAVYTSLRSYLFRQVDATLQMSQQSVEAAAVHPSDADPGMAQPPGGAGQPGASTFCALGRESSPGMFIEVLTSTNTPVSGDTCPAFTPGRNSYSPRLTSVIADRSAGAPTTTYFTVPSTVASGPTFRVRASELSGGGLLIVAAPISDISSTLDHLLILEGAVTGGALLVSVMVGLWLVRVGLRPLRDVVATAEAISEGDLVHRVPNANARTEFGRVASALNVMLERIQSGFLELQSSEVRLRRFVADASHELRTPIAAVSAYAQLFRYGAARNGSETERVMSGIEHESARMARLVEDLLLLARFDERRPIQAEPVELVGLAMEAVETARVVGPQWPIVVEAGNVVEATGDPVALRQVIDNLLKNVRSHTPPGTKTTVRVERIDDQGVLEVEDEGPGLSEMEADLVFERFFRADPSRSRDTGGAGLGLAIVTSIVQAHGGTVEVVPGANGGARFRVMLPNARAASDRLEHQADIVIAR
jgi:two-component system, OmpR family, sensor kinase